MKKGWFSIGKLKDKKNKTEKKDKVKDADKEKKDALYDNFLKETKTKKKSVENEYDPSKDSAAPTNDENNGKNSNANRQNNKKPKSNQQQQQQKKTVEQMVDELDPAEFEDLISNIKSKFPNSNSAWLSEAAFYLNNNMPSNVKDVLGVFNSALDYPCSLLKENFHKKLNDLFQLFTTEELYQVQLSIIESVIPNIYLTSLSGPVGYLLFLQSLSLYLGQNSSESIERLASAEVRNKYKEKPNVYLTQVWCLQSAGVLSLKEGLTVWKRLYLPVLDHKYFYQFGLKYLSSVLSIHSNYKDEALDIIGVKDLVRILKLKAAAEHQEILEKMLPKLKFVVLSNQSDEEIANSFKELISNLSSFKNEPQLEEFVISCLVFCLEKNKQCFDIWYEHHRTTSSNRDPLLEHLLANPNAVQSQRKVFRSTLQKIGKFNDKQGQQTNYQSKDILKTMSNSKSCKSNLVLLTTLALLAYIIYDTRLNGSFERSDTARYLKKWKVYPYVQPVAINIERNVVSWKRQYDVKYGPTVNSYVDQIVRQYDSNVRPTIDPVLGQVVNASTPYVVSLKEHSVQAYRYAAKYYTVYSRQAGLFLQKNVFTGPLEINNLKLVFNDLYEKTAIAYSDAYRWVSNKLAQLVQQ